MLRFSFSPMLQDTTGNQAVSIVGLIDSLFFHIPNSPNNRSRVQSSVQGVGTDKHPRSFPKDAYVVGLAKWTLTDLYNARPGLT